MTAPLDLASELFGPDPQMTNRVLWDSRCAVPLHPGGIPVAVESLCTACVKARNFRWRENG